MKSYSASDEPCFSSSISVVEPTDPAHADAINAAPKQLLENTAANRNEITELKEKSLEKMGDSSKNIVTFESADSKNVTSWTDVPVMESKENHKSLLTKISTMFKNVRFLYKILGNEDISEIADGTVTGVLQEYKQALDGKVNITSILETIEQVDANTSAKNIADALVIKALKAELTNSINQINSNLEVKSYINPDSTGYSTLLEWYLSQDAKPALQIVRASDFTDLPRDNWGYTIIIVNLGTIYFQAYEHLSNGTILYREISPSGTWFGEWKLF